MNESDAVTKAKINYFCREKYYQNMQRETQEGLKKFTGDPVYKFYYGLSLILEGRIQEGIREIDSLQDDPQVMLGVILAMIYAHRKYKVVDKEKVAELDTKLKDMRKKASDKGLYYAGLFLFHTGRYDKAREYIDRMLKMNSTFREGLVLKGWTEMMNSKESRETKGKTAVQFFDTVLNSPEGKKDIDALFGKAKFFELKNNFSGALEMINQIIANLPAQANLPGVIEKMKMLLALQDWDQTVDMAQRILNVEPHCLEAQRFCILQLVCREGNYDEASSKLSDFAREVGVYQPKNANLLYQTAKLFSRMCGRHNGILQQTFSMATQAVNLDNQNAEYLTELGYQSFMQNKSREAMKLYQSAIKLDGSSVAALTGIVMCQIMEGQYDNAEQQLEFLREVQMTMGPSAELLYLHAVHAKKKNKNTDEIIRLLDESVHAHFNLLKGLPLGIQYYLLLDPDFLILLIKEYLGFAPTQPLNPSQTIPSVLKQCVAVVEPITKACPGMLEGLYLFAKIKYLTGNLKSAATTLQHIFDNVNSTYSDAYLLMAQIQLHQNNFQQASHFLEVGLSYNFEVRDNPSYHVIKAQIQKKENKYEEALKTLQVAMSLSGINISGTASARKRKIEISPTEKASLYMELADVYRLLNQHHEAIKVMDEANKEFAGTPEEARITVVNADLALARDDVDGALGMLRSIGSTHPYYMQAREKMADIYLNYLKDKRMFASCYREIVDKFPKNIQAYLLLGDAYMNIQEPEMAIDVYEKALKENPRDTSLASKIGQALVKTHNYGKAVNYYKEALKNEEQSFLRYDLADLYMGLRQYDKAEKLLTQSLDNNLNQGSDLASLVTEAKSLTLLANIYQKSGNVTSAVKTLLRAKDVQVRALKKAAIEQPDIVGEQRTLSATICCNLAEHAAVQREFDKAITLYKEAVNYDEKNSQAMLDLAHLYMIVGDLESCQQTCTELLKNDAENDSATVMMANLNFFRNEYDSALVHFQQLLDRKPDSYDALARLIELLRRMGKLELAIPYLERAEHHSSRAQIEPGFNCCRALYEWYAGNPNGALKLFNKARKDNEWGQRAVRCMIEISLNPDNIVLGGQMFEDTNANFDRQDYQDVALNTADKLLKELKPIPGDISAIILGNNILLATRQKVHAERALNEFVQLSSNDLYREHVSIILGMAIAYMILKQTPRARNQLKRITKNMWNFEDAEDLERGWLLLADIYTQSGKYDMATELLRRVLQHNRSCCKAYEYMGYIMEKEQSYKDAAAHYELAWKYSNKTNPTIGYKLAFNYMKAKRFVDAIDVCHLVLDKYPNYPKIRKDILEKSRSNLRV